MSKLLSRDDSWQNQYRFKNSPANSTRLNVMLAVAYSKTVWNSGWTWTRPESPISMTVLSFWVIGSYVNVVVTAICGWCRQFHAIAASLTTLLSGNYSESKIDMVEILNRKLKGWLRSISSLILGPVYSAILIVSCSGKWLIGWPVNTLWVSKCWCFIGVSHQNPA